MRAAPRRRGLLAVLALCGAAAACSKAQPMDGRQAALAAGCGACHDIPGITGARGGVGPSLRGVGRRVYLAGVLPNTPANMALWIARPQSVLPGNAMPDTGLSKDQAKALAGYLESLD